MSTLNRPKRSHDADAVRARPSEAIAHRHVRTSITEVVDRLAADEADRKEMRIVREQVADLAPPPRD